MLLRRPVREGDAADYYTEYRIGDILGFTMRGGEWCRPLPDGCLEMVPLADPPVPPGLWAEAFPEGGPPPDLPLEYRYAFLGDRVVTFADLYPPGPDSFGAYAPCCTTLLHDTAGILSPCALASWLIQGTVHLMPDGGFLAAAAPRCDNARPSERARGSALVRWGADGRPLWTLQGVDCVLGAADGTIYAAADRGCGGTPGEGRRLLALRPDGRAVADCPIPCSPLDTEVRLVGGRPCLLEPQNYRGDVRLRRLTRDLRPDGEALVPAMPGLSLSPDGRLLYCAGWRAGLQVMDAATLEVLARRDCPEDLCTPIVDGQNRLWVSGRGGFACYDQRLDLVSRHRVPGTVCSLHRTAAGEVCAVTFQERRCLIRVYRFY